MAEIRALVVDDEPLARRGIRQLLAPFEQITIVGECRDGREALRALDAQRPDLVFLDVEMPGLDGLGVIAAYGADRMPATVFVTAHEEFAVRAFETQALDYLVKPLSERRFRATIARVLARLGNGQRRRRPSDQRIAVPTSTGERLLEPGEITWIEAQDDYALVHAGPQVFRLRASLGALAAQLGSERFVRVHRTAVVRIDVVRELQAPPGRREVVVVLRDGTTVPVSRRRVGHVRAALRRSPR